MDFDLSMIVTRGGLEPQKATRVQNPTRTTMTKQITTTKKMTMSMVTGMAKTKTKTKTKTANVLYQP